jgi:hypothetical protein
MIKINEIVPLAIQLFDDNPNIDVMCRVFGVANEILFEGPLSHVKDGLYETKQFIMPDQPYVVATYWVVGSKEYARAAETFYRDNNLPETRGLLDEYAPKYDNYYTGNILNESKDDFIEGFLNGSIET